MSTKKTLYFLFSSAGMLVLILDGATALEGAASGIDLCIRVVIPSLLPFLFLSSLLTGSLWGNGGKVLRTLGKIIKVPKGAESVLISGFLGGYPAGAQTIGQAYRDGGLDAGSASRLLSFCSNAGPAFLFGVTASQFPDRKTVWILWVIHVLSALMVGALSDPGQFTATRLSPLDRSPVIALTGAVKTTGLLCGWIICFRILLTFLDRWFLWLLPKPAHVLTWGILELSNGCCCLASIEPFSLRFIICSVMLAFGGICVAMQTASVTEGLPLKSYLVGKLIHAVFAGSLSLLYLRFGVFSILLPAIFLYLPSILKKRSSFPGYSGV